MKTKISTILSIVMLTLGLTSCDEQWTPQTGNETKAELSLRSLGVDVSDAENVINDNSRAAIDVNPFIVKIYDGQGLEQGVWTFGEMPEIVTLPVGSYRVGVYSHEIQKAEWEKPFFYGEKNFNIENNKINEIGVVTSRFNSLKVSIRFTDALRAVMGDDVKVDVIANDEGHLAFTAEETRSGYFELPEGSTTLVATFTGTVKGTKENIRKVITDAARGQHRIITYDVKTNPDIPGADGEIDPTAGINVDIDVDSENLTGNVDAGEDIIDGGERPGTEEPEEPVDPGETTPAAEFTSETLDLEGDNQASDFGAESDGLKPAVVNIHSEKGVAHLNVEIISQSLNKEMLQGVGLDSSFDLAYPGALEATLRDSFGFPVSNDVIGANDLVFNITDFVPLLLIYPGETHQFKLTVTDAEGNVSEIMLTFKS